MKSTTWLLRGAALAAVLLGVGCVAPVQKMALTASGKPELTISATLTDVKSAILGEMVNHGYSVDQDTDYMMRMSRPLKGGEDFGAALAVGNAYSSNRRVTIFTFVKQPEGIRVVVSSAWSAQMPGGQVNTTELTDNGNIFNAFETMLQDIKARLENK